MKHTISVLVENEFGVLARISGLFSSRGYNIQSLTVAETLDPKISRMTLVTSGTNAVLDQIVKQLDKLVNVITVQDVTRDDPVNRILALVKLGIDAKTKAKVLREVKSLKGEVLKTTATSLMVEFRGDGEFISQVLKKLKAYPVLDFMQTGNLAMVA